MPKATATTEPAPLPPPADLKSYLLELQRLDANIDALFPVIRMLGIPFGNPGQQPERLNRGTFLLGDFQQFLRDLRNDRERLEMLLAACRPAPKTPEGHWLNKTLGADGCDELGGNIHTALRKACDSHPTTLLYALIERADAEWVAFLRVLWAHLIEVPKPSFPQVARAVRDAAQKFRSVSHYGGNGAKNNGYLLALGFLSLSDDDLRGTLAYVLPEKS